MTGCLVPLLQLSVIQLVVFLFWLAVCVVGSTKTYFCFRRECFLPLTKRNDSFSHCICETTWLPLLDIFLFVLCCITLFGTWSLFIFLLSIVLVGWKGTLSVHCQCYDIDSYRCSPSLFSWYHGIGCGL